MRKPRNQRYKLKAYYIENDNQSTFYCKRKRLTNITNDMGQSIPMANGESILETDSDLVFKAEQTVKIGNEELSVQKSDGDVDSKNLNSMRGKPSYIQFVLVK